MSIYFIQDLTTRAVKVGFSRDVTKRLSQLRTSSPFQLQLIGEILGTLDDEQALHREFTGDFRRLAGEWYEGSDRFMRRIGELLAKDRSLRDFAPSLLRAAIRLIDEHPAPVTEALLQLRRAVDSATTFRAVEDDPCRVRRTSRRASAGEWLIHMFRRQRIWLSQDLFTAAAGAGISRNAIYEARDQLQVPKPRRFIRDDGSVAWRWQVPEDWPFLSQELTDSTSSNYLNHMNQLDS